MYVWRSFLHQVSVKLEWGPKIIKSFLDKTQPVQKTCGRGEEEDAQYTKIKMKEEESLQTREPKHVENGR